MWFGINNFGVVLGDPGLILAFTKHKQSYSTIEAEHDSRFKFGVLLAYVAVIIGHPIS